ncbi:hypothetical protein K461DRAFT_67808 [Myriangium duriaei CBS 260.36]|uniref:Uncharacterized protein n=1 Tax=Myriangium duriaei CBS 260.36 TaxID=1168546 RepID=A0A9P4IQ50_9PEZI|nr:hypothetical protein K461DRAFT_67808 [Myriangium duriaei CBS 260.36]
MIFLSQAGCKHCHTTEQSSCRDYGFVNTKSKHLSQFNIITVGSRLEALSKLQPPNSLCRNIIFPASVMTRSRHRGSVRLSEDHTFLDWLISRSHPAGRRMRYFFSLQPTTSYTARATVYLLLALGFRPVRTSSVLSIIYFPDSALADTHIEIDSTIACLWHRGRASVRYRVRDSPRDRYELVAALLHIQRCGMIRIRRHRGNR